VYIPSLLFPYQGNQRKDGKVMVAPASIDLLPVFPLRVEEGGRGWGGRGRGGRGRGGRGAGCC